MYLFELFVIILYFSIKFKYSHYFRNNVVNFFYSNIGIKGSSLHIKIKDYKILDRLPRTPRRFFF